MNAPTGNKMTLDSMCDLISVGDVDDHHNESNGGKLSGILGWCFVDDSERVIAYFANETDAFRFRLDLINQKLNPLQTGD
jgi:hypothetical protein